MPESSSILKSLVVVGATAAATLSAFGLYWIIERSTTETKTRRASYRCSCGEVEASIIIPAANYRYSEIPSFQCACCDCVGFCERVLESGSAKLDNFCSPGAQHLLVHDSEIQMVKGREYLQSVKLSTTTDKRRIYSSCCGTPFGVSPDHSHINLIYTPNLREEEVLMEMEVDFPPLPPSAVLYSRMIKPGKPQPPMGTRTRFGGYDTMTILHCVGRTAVLFFLGEKGPGKGFPIVGNVEIGLDTIKTKH